MLINIRYDVQIIKQWLKTRKTEKILISVYLPISHPLPVQPARHTHVPVTASQTSKAFLGQEHCDLHKLP